MSQFVENAVRTLVTKRKDQAEFIRRGIAAIEATKHDCSGVLAEVIAKLETSCAVFDLQAVERLLVASSPAASKNTTPVMRLNSVARRGFCSQWRARAAVTA